MGIDEGYMLTLARLGQLETLNFSRITPQERRNAEMYYLSRIAKAVAEVPEDKDAELLACHPRYEELCRSECPLDFGSPSDEHPMLTFAKYMVLP